MRKFARVVKSVYESDIAEKIDADSKMKRKGAAAQIAVVSEMKPLNEELDDEGENKLLK
jgi:hypothetical protein